MDLHNPLSLAAIKAPINFLKPAKDRPVAYHCPPPPGVPVRTGDYVPRLVSIRNARPIADNLSLDHEGFALVQAAGAFAEFDDDEAIRRFYYPEVERILQAATGAARVIAFDHNIRNARRATAGEARIREPVSRAHNDFTERSGPDRARRELEGRGFDAGSVLRGRFAMINLWRPTVSAVETWPIALCDASTVAAEDLIVSDLIYADRVGEIYSLAYSPTQRWYFFPRLAPVEAILIKGYDTAASGAARFAPHTAFYDPKTSDGAPERESIEARALVIYPD